MSPPRVELNLGWVDARLVEALQARAQVHGRTVEAEAELLLRDALRPADEEGGGGSWWDALPDPTDLLQVDGLVDLASLLDG